MALYLLPTKGSTRYTGKRPNGVRYVSTSPRSLDIDGVRCVHFETNCGERYTVTLDCMEPQPGFSGMVGKQFHDLLKNGTPLVTMTREQYAAWTARNPRTED